LIGKEGSISPLTLCIRNTDYLFLYSNDTINHTNLNSNKSETIKTTNMKANTCPSQKKSYMEMGGRGIGDTNGADC
jgi:hypothetical protein